MASEATVGTLIGTGITILVGLLVLSVVDKGPGPGTAPGPIVLADLEPPAFCRTANAKPGQPVIIKTGTTYNSDGSPKDLLIHPPGNCSVKDGTVLTWSADISAKSMSIRFVKDPDALCSANSDGENPDQDGVSSISAVYNGTTLQPLSITANRPSVPLQKYPYCLTVNGIPTPKPAIIVKE